MLETLLAAQIALSVASSTIPVQPPVSDPMYETFFEKAASKVGENTSECAKFVNRIFLARFGKMMFGDAWTLQILPENQKYLDLVWRLKENQFIRKQELALPHYEDRVEHFNELYAVLENDEHPIGVLGFVFQYSFYRENIAAHPEWLPQTHVAFLAGRKQFSIQNTSSKPQTIEQILSEEFGKIHEFERDFVNEKVPLSIELLPGGTYFYNDYLIEEHFRSPMKGSLLELFLRKHRNNRTTPLLRPVSYSRISKELIREVKNQEELFESFGGVDFVSGKHFSSLQIPHKELWQEFLVKRLGMKNPENYSIVPVPKNKEVVFSNK